MPQTAEVTQVIPALGRTLRHQQSSTERSYYLIDICELDKRPSKKRKRRDSDDIYEETDRPWNIAQLRHFYTYHLPRLCNRHLYMINEIKHLVHS
jgi:hypothetical protein